jgi:hypothetical protein
MEEKMNTIKSYFQARYLKDDRIISASLITNTNQYSPWTDSFDILLLIVTEKSEYAQLTSHYIKDNYRIQERWMDCKHLESRILSAENRDIIQWILQGEILVDRNTYLEGLRHRLMEFPHPLRQQKLFVEFSIFLRRYLQSKQYLSDGHLLDAYSNLLKAVHHWARIVIIEEGYHPEITVWKQVRKINPGVYKIYEELTASGETLEQRARLVLLACEFSVMSKMHNCCDILFNILRDCEEPWSVHELMEHPALRELNVELPLLLQRLAKKSLIREVAVLIDQELGILELKYTM